MPLFTEILTTHNMAVLGDERQHFTVNNTVNTVNLDEDITSPTWPVGRLRNGVGQPVFAPNDSLRILAVGIILPYSYAFAPPMPVLTLAWVETPNPTIFDSVGGLSPRFIAQATSRFVIPFENAEFSVDVPCLPPSVYTKPFLAATLMYDNTVNLSKTAISMVGSPAALQGSVLPVCPFIKLQHFLPLSLT